MGGLGPEGVFGHGRHVEVTCEEKREPRPWAAETLGERALRVPKSLVGIWILLSSVGRALPFCRVDGNGLRVGWLDTRMRWTRSRLVDDVRGEDMGL